MVTARFVSSLAEENSQWSSVFYKININYGSVVFAFQDVHELSSNLCVSVTSYSKKESKLSTIKNMHVDTGGLS